MCGRFVGFRNIEQLKFYFPIDVSKCEAMINYNVAPSQEILAIVRFDGHNVLDRYHWGLVPHWAKDKSIGYKMINARAETVANKPSFRTAFKKQRCLIPADGFYEWKRQNKIKQPIFFTLPDKSPFAFAGLWETWQNSDEIYRSCTIITREAKGPIKEVHHRMPVILKPGEYDHWLNIENQDVEKLQNILETEYISELVSHPVDKKVNSVRNNDASNMEPVQLEFDF
jgi:putative SOS response-associated peptidase YedK